jgi:fused signal recognition particle receptor
VSEEGDARAAWAELFEIEPPATEEEAAPRRRGLLGRLRESLSKPRQAVSPQLAGVFAGKLVTEEDWEALEEALITADCGMEAAMELVEELRAEAAEGRIIDGPSLARGLWDAIAERMAPEPPRIPIRHSPTVIAICGVNGSGKTTTVGKIAHRLTELGQTVVIGAADTFRAAAVDQLATWADRAGAQLVRQAPGADPGAVAYDAVAAGTARKADVVLIDTAGRLQTQHNLMEELRKVIGVMGKVDPEAPHETLLVLDATTGQNGISQARLFGEAVPLSGVVLTKLDGAAKGGVAVAINSELGLPVKLVGTGERLEDLQPFDARAFAQAIFST